MIGTPPRPRLPVVILDQVVAGIGQLDLLGAERDGDLRTMLLELTSLSGIGRIRGVADGQLQAEVYLNIRGLLLQVAEDPFFLVRILLSMW